MEDAQENTSAPSQPRMIDIVAAELTDLQATSLTFREKVEGAKTNAKRQYFMKKLKKNNKKMMNMLVAFEKLRGKEVSTETNAENIPEPEVPNPLDLIPDIPEEECE
jgi:hypothetical protein